MQIVLGVFGVHIIVWAFLLIMSLTVGATDAFQQNCSSDLPIAYWSRVVGIVAIAHWAVMVLLWFLFLASLIKWSVKPKTKNKTEDEKKRYQRDPLEMYVRARAFELALHALMLPMYSLARLTYWPWLMDVVHPIKEGWSLKREIVRWSISSFFYFVWFSAYVSLYILALQRFVMVGDNPFDYGQVAACVVSPSSSGVFSSTELTLTTSLFCITGHARWNRNGGSLHRERVGLLSESQRDDPQQLLHPPSPQFRRRQQGRLRRGCHGTKSTGGAIVG